MAEEEVGVVIKFFVRPGVAALKITKGSIKKGDILKYKGYTTDFNEEIKSLEIDNQHVDEARVGDTIGIKVKERVREKDVVYKVVD